MSNLIHDGPVQFSDVFEQVQTNLYEAKLRWYTSTNIYDALQEAYNKINAQLCLTEKATFIPQLPSPYYNMGQMIPDWMFLRGVYNVFTNLWLDGVSYKVMKNTYYTYLTIGDPRFFNVIDLQRVLIWPFNTSATGVLFIVYAASAPIITPDLVPDLPFSVASQVLECFATADLLEQAREFGKAQNYWNRLLKPPREGVRSLMLQAELEVKALARYDRESVLEPYRWLFHGGTLNPVNWIFNETPAGTIDGTNVTFTLAQVPNPITALLLMRNGVVLFQGIGYTISGQTITFQTGYIPQPPSGADTTGDLIRAFYQIN